MVERYRPRSEPKPWQFKNGHKRIAGRAKGTKNKLPTEVKEALLEAVKLYGKDGKGKDALVGYFSRFCGKRPDLIFSMLRQILPLQVKVATQHEETVMHRFENIDTSKMTLAEIQAAQAEAIGLSKPLTPRPKLLELKATEIEQDDDEAA